MVQNVGHFLTHCAPKHSPITIKIETQAFVNRNRLTMIVPLLTSAVCIEANGEKLSLVPSKKSEAVAELRENDIFAKGDAKSVVNRNEDPVARKRQLEEARGRRDEHVSRSRDENAIDIRVPRSGDANLARKMAKDALKSPRMQEAMRKLTHGRRRLRKPKHRVSAKSSRRKPLMPKRKHGRRMKIKRRRKRPKKRFHRRRFKAKQASLPRRGSSKNTRRDINASAGKLNGNEKSIVERAQKVADDKSRDKQPLEKSNSKITVVRVEDNDYIDFSTPLSIQSTVALIETRNDDDESVKQRENENMIERLMRTTTKDPLKKPTNDLGVEYSDYYSEDDLLQDIAANQIPIRVVDPTISSDRFTRQSVNSTSFYTNSQIDSDLQPYYGDYDARGNDITYNDYSGNNVQNYPIDEHLTGFDRNSRFLGAGESTNHELSDDRNEYLNIARPVSAEDTSVQDSGISGLQSNYYMTGSNLENNPQSVNFDQFNYQYGNEASNLNLNGAQNLNSNDTQNLNSIEAQVSNPNEAQNLNLNKAPILNPNEAQNLNLNKAPILNPNEAQNLNLNNAPILNPNEAQNLNLNKAPILNPNEAQNLNLNNAPILNPNEAPILNLNLNKAPILNPNEAQNLNLNKAPILNSNEAQNLNLNKAPILNSNETQNLNLNKAPILNPNEAQNLNSNKAPILNPNEATNLYLNEAQSSNSNEGVPQTMATKVICLPNEHPVVEVSQSKYNVPEAQNMYNYQPAISQQHLENIEQSTTNRLQIGGMRLPGTKEEGIDARPKLNFKDLRNQSLQNCPTQERNELPSVKLPNPMNQPLGKVLESLGINVNTDSSNRNLENVATVSWSTQMAQPLNNNSLSFSNMLDRPLDRKLNPSHLRKKPGDDLRWFLAARTKNANVGGSYTRRQLDQNGLLDTNQGFNEDERNKSSNKNVSLGLNDTKEIANQLLDTIIEELELKSNRERNKKREGSWSTTQAGMKLDMKVVNRTIIVTVPDLASPRFHESLFNGTWNVSGHAPFKRGSPFTLIATNNHTSSIAVFIGACRVCQGIDTIAGVWSVARPPKDCRDFQVATNVFNDIFRKTKRSSVKEKVTNATKITITTTEKSS
ncbi:uncharacterized protein LOC143145940 isoform X2 [Ptiloglossa arizonensis]|uniref:uncharacterized protein LOC143145940 isoform X2 n=1 Tax=Ptiloglossa arizonensis TaxID=3350558 RepID=UPI003FA18321